MKAHFENKVNQKLILQQLAALKLFPQGMALSACGIGQSSTPPLSDEPTITVLHASKRQYVGSSEPEKLIISQLRLADSLPTSVFIHQADYSHLFGDHCQGYIVTSQ